MKTQLVGVVNDLAEYSVPEFWLSKLWISQAYGMKKGAKMQLLSFLGNSTEVTCY